MRGQRPFGALVAGLLLLAAALPSQARAYEDRISVGLELGAGFVVIPDSDLPSTGALAGLSGSVGLDDVWSLRGHLAYALHPAAEPLHVGLFGLELLYLVDIVQIVPFFGAGLDLLATVLDGTGGAEAGAHVVVGAEYLLSRDLLVGIDIRSHFLPLAIAEDGRVEPVYLTVDVRMSFLFEM